MSKSTKRKHAMVTRDFGRFNNVPYNYEYGGVYFIHSSHLPPPYYSQIPPPYHYEIPNGGLPALPSTYGVHLPTENSYYPKRAKLQETEHKKVKKNESREDKTNDMLKDKQKDKNKKKDEKKSEEMGKSRPPILKRISNGIVHGLETFFYRLGMLVACHPKKTIAICTVISGLLGIGLINMKTDKDFAALLIPLSSRIHTDQQWVADNIPFELRFVQMIPVNDNIMTKDSLLAIHEIYTASLNLTVDGVGITDICTDILGNCFITSVLDLWDYDKTVIETLTDEQIQEKINTTELNPRYYVEFDRDRYLGGLTVDAEGKVIAAKAAKMIWYFSANTTNKDLVLKFERELIEVGKRGMPGLEDVHVLSLESLSDEFFDTVFDDVIQILFGMPAVLFYMIIAMGKPNLLEHGLFLVFSAIFGVLLASAACFGICLFTGLLFGTLHAGLVFLLLGIGVDDCFVIVETWKRVDRENPEKPLEEKMALTMKHAGVSITVTSISDFAAFAAGISSLMPILSSFCVFCAVGMLSLFIIQATFFPACLFLDQKRIRAGRDGVVPCYTHKNYKPNRFSNVEILEPFFKEVWARLLLSIPGKVIILLLSAGLIGVMGWSISKLQKGFDVENALHKESYARQFVDATTQYFPGEGFPFAVYCDTKDYYAHHKALIEMEAKYKNNTAILNGVVTSWIRPFKLYLQFVKQFNGDPIVLDEDGFPVDKDVFDEYLYDFIHTSGFGDAYKVYIDVKNSSGVDIDWTIYRMQMVVDADPAVNDQRLADIRHIADTTSTDGTCFAYGEPFVFTETTEYVDRELLRNFLLAGVSVFVVVLLLVVDLRSSLLVLMCVAFTTVCLGGTLQLAGFMIDGNIVIMTTFCIGLSVDFSAHIAYVFMTVKGTRTERAKKSLQKIGPAIFHGAFSTIIVVAWLSRALSYTMFLFFITNISIMLYGLFAGLCLLPVILSLIGADPYPDAENFQAPPDGHNWYNSELMPRSRIWRIPRPQLENRSADIKVAVRVKPIIWGNSPEEADIKDVMNSSSSEASEKQTGVSGSSSGTLSGSEDYLYKRK